MKMTLLLTDEITPVRPLLQNAAPTEARFQETEMTAGCNCDRWGHPCTGCVERNAQGNAELPISTRAKQTTPFNGLHQQA